MRWDVTTIMGISTTQNRGRYRLKRFFFSLTTICLLALFMFYLLSSSSSSLPPVPPAVKWNNPDDSYMITSKIWATVIGQSNWSTTSASGTKRFEKNLPGCIIVGVRKCGTRALLEFLDIHPQMVKVINEIHFFDDDKNYNLGLEWYRQQMPSVDPNVVVIEKTPAYFVTDSVPERIYAMNSSIKIILIVRDPVTRLISDYAQLASNKAARNETNFESFENVVLLPNGQINIGYKGVRISMYAVYFSRWIKLFSKNQIHVVDGDRFVYDPLPELKNIEKFLGLRSYLDHRNFLYNITKGFYCIRMDNDTGRCLNKNKGRRHPDINPVVLKKLRKFYQPYNRYFFRLAGRRFSWPD